MQPPTITSSVPDISPRELAERLIDLIEADKQLRTRHAIELALFANLLFGIPTRPWSGLTHWLKTRYPPATVT